MTLSGGKKLYFVYSFAQASPQLWKKLDIKTIMISVDDVKLDKLDELKGLDLMLDSGGFRRLSKGKELKPEEVLNKQKLVVELTGALPIILDYPPRSPEEAWFSIKRTAKNVKLWQRAFGDRFVYVVHGFSEEHFAEALKALDSPPEVVALGGVALKSRSSPKEVLRRFEALRAMWDGKLHALGVGNSLALALFLLDLADSADSSGYLTDASFRMIRDPETMGMRKVHVGERCYCEHCKGREVGKAGREGVIARAEHNAYWLLRALEDESLALSMISRRAPLRKAVLPLLRRRTPGTRT